MGGSLTIGTLARAAGVNVETVRFYQRKGLLRQPLKPYGGIRRYQESDLDRLRFIRSAQKLGFSLDEIAGLLRLDDGAHCGEAHELGQQKLDEVRQRLAGLRRMEQVLSKLVAQCEASEGEVSCPLIESLQQGLEG